MNLPHRHPIQHRIDDESAPTGRLGPASRAGAPASRLRFRASHGRIWALLASLGPVDLNRDQILDHLRAHDPTLPSASVDGIINGMEHRGLLTRRTVRTQAQEDLILFRVKPLGDADAPPAARTESDTPHPPLRREGRPGRRPSHSTNPIMTVLSAAGDAPLSRSDIHRHLALTGNTMSLSTVYRTMSALERKGLVLTEWGADREARYRIKPAGFDAQTLCVRCDSTGRRVEIADRALLGRLIALAQEHGIETAGKTITIAFSD